MQCSSLDLVLRRNQVRLDQNQNRTSTETEPGQSLGWVRRQSQSRNKLRLDQNQNNSTAGENRVSEELEPGQSLTVFMEGGGGGVKSF